MKAVRIHRFGEPEVLTVCDVQEPTVGPGDVLVNVHAAGVNYFEVLMRRNRYAVQPNLPATFGVEVAGVVEAAGRDAAVGIGTRVAVPLFAIGRDGGYAQYICVDAAQVVPLPDGISFPTSVALLVQGLTALHAVRRSPPNGKSVLVNAAAGGVGSMLIQLAKSSGVGHLTAIASSEEKRRVALSLGADAVLSSDAESLQSLRSQGANTGFELIYDFVGGEQTHSLLQALAPGGEMVFGALGRFSLRAEEMNSALTNGQSITGFALLHQIATADIRSDLEFLFGLVTQGRLRPIVGHRFPLREAAAAHRLIETRAAIGKTVLEPWS